MSRPFERSEYEARWSQAMRSAHEAGLPALLVWGRGGGPIERHGNVLYLTDYYSAFPIIPDIEGHWADRGYAAVLLTEGECVLFADAHEAGPEDAVATHVIPADDDLVSRVAGWLRERGLAEGLLGLVGGDVMTRDQSQRLADLLPGLVLEPATALLERICRIKSPAEQQVMRRCNSIGAQAVTALMEAGRAGVTEAELAAIAAGKVIGEGAVLYNAYVETYGPQRTLHRHRMPTYSAEQPLAKGEILTIDFSAGVEGYYCDLSRSRIVDQPPTDRQRRLLEASRAAVKAVVAALRPGTTAGEATRAGLRVLEEEGLLEAEGSFDAMGHGLGLSFESPWLTPDNPMEILPGMCLAVEKMVFDGPWAAIFEDNVLITEGGAEPLAELREVWW